MKLIRAVGKSIFTAIILVYAFCLFNGITFFDYSVTDNGGTLYVVGNSYDVSSPVASNFWQLYTSAESRAAELLPEQLEQAIDWVYKQLSELN